MWIVHSQLLACNKMLALAASAVLNMHCMDCFGLRLHQLLWTLAALPALAPY